MLARGSVEVMVHSFSRQWFKEDAYAHAYVELAEPYEACREDGVNRSLAAAFTVPVAKCPAD
jgi:hypothetical protein